MRKRNLQPTLIHQDVWNEEAIQKYVKRLETLHEIGGAILAAHSLEEITRAVLNRVVALVPCYATAVILYDFDDSQLIVYAQQYTNDGQIVWNVPFPLSDSWAINKQFGELQQGQMVIVDDMETLPRTALIQSAIEEGVRSIVIAPILSHGKLIGTFAVGANHLDGFGLDDVDIIRELANSLAIAIAQVQLLEDMSMKKDSLRRLTHQLIKAQETERRRLTQDLHDRVGSNLAALSINLNIMSSRLVPDFLPELGVRINDSLMLVEDTIETIRDVTAELSLAILDEYGLAAASRGYIHRYQQRTGITVEFQQVGGGGQPRPEQRIALYRIAQEVLTNVAKHAQASRVTITLETIDKMFRLTIVDNGVGFNPDDLAKSLDSKGMGLLSIRDRAESIGGFLRVESAQGRGTCVIVELKEVDHADPSIVG